MPSFAHTRKGAGMASKKLLLSWIILSGWLCAGSARADLLPSLKQYLHFPRIKECFRFPRIKQHFHCPKSEYCPAHYCAPVVFRIRAYCTKPTPYLYSCDHSTVMSGNQDIIPFDCPPVEPSVMADLYLRSGRESAHTVSLLAPVAEPTAADAAPAGEATPAPVPPTQDGQQVPGYLPGYQPEALPSMR